MLVIPKTNKLCAIAGSPFQPCSALAQPVELCDANGHEQARHKVCMRTHRVLYHCRSQLSFTRSGRLDAIRCILEGDGLFRRMRRHLHPTSACPGLTELLIFLSDGEEFPGSGGLDGVHTVRYHIVTRHISARIAMHAISFPTLRKNVPPGGTYLYADVLVLPFGHFLYTLPSSLVVLHPGRPSWWYVRSRLRSGIRTLESAEDHHVGPSSSRRFATDSAHNCRVVSR